ncbi:MAG: cupin domain-containing protein [Myxococcota bacterium]
MQVLEKPWGMEEILEQNGLYVLKRLTMYGEHRCSLQYHRRKRETIYVLSGQLRIYLGPTADQLQERAYGPNESVTIEPGWVHRMEAIEDTVYLEASTPELNDVVRLADDYARLDA